MRTIAEIDADIKAIEKQLEPLKEERRAAVKECDHDWRRHNYVIDGECYTCEICGEREKIWGCGL